MQLIICSPDVELVNITQVDWVNLKLSDGYPISIYPKHAPMIALTSACKLKYRVKDQIYEKHIPAGILSISGNKVKYWIAEDEPRVNINEKLES